MHLPAAVGWVSLEETDERDTEYANLADQLKIDWVATYSLNLHARHVRADGSPLWGHLQAVSRAARKLVEDYYQMASVSESRYWVKVAQAAALLHESQQRCGTSFESISGVDGPADEAVARVVGALTLDVRVPRPLRNEMLANAVGRGGPVAQIVKLLDLRHDAIMFTELHRQGTPMIRTEIFDFCMEALHVLDSLTEIREHKWAQKVLRETNCRLEPLQDHYDCPKRRVRRP
jgi:hypothetical protein